MSNEECKVLATTIASAICADEWGESMSMRSDEALVKKYLAALYHFGKPSKDYFASSGRMKKNVFRSAILKHFNEFESLKVDLKNKFEKISKESSYLSGGSINAVKSSLEDTSVESIGHTHSLHINLMYYGFFVAMGLEDPRSDDGFPNIKMMIQPDVNHRPIEVERFLYNYEKKQKSYKGIVSYLFQDKLCNISSVNTELSRPCFRISSATLVLSIPSSLATQCCRRRSLKKSMTLGCLLFVLLRILRSSRAIFWENLLQGTWKKVSLCWL